MAFPILGSPRAQFSDATSVLASGTLQILEPTDDSNKTYYPTADDADAGTNGASGDLTLDANGFVPDGLFGVDDEKYKVVLKDSSGTTLWTENDVRLPTRLPSLYGKTAQTLTDAGAVTLTESTTFVVTTTASALTLADGVENQHKLIVMKTDAGLATLTPSNFANGSTILFSNVGDSASLYFLNGSWHWVGGSARVTSSIHDDLIKKKTADETATSDDTLSDDTHLAIYTLEANSYYRIEGVFVMTSTSATPDFKFALQTDQAFVDGRWGFASSDEDGTAVQDSGPLTTAMSIAIAANKTNVVHLHGYVLTHATADATVDLQWAQNTSDATATSFERGSWLQFVKLT